MISSLPASAPRRAGIITLLQTKPWIAIYVVFTLTALMPEVRRLIDWKTGFAVVSILSIVPLIALVPFAFIDVMTWFRDVPRAVGVCAWLWFGVFTYSLAVGFFQVGKLPALYTYVGFVLPMAFGVWISTLRSDATTLYDRVADFIFNLTTPIAVYALIQYTILPAWDAAWMRSANISSMGVAVPFEFRPFGTLNSHGPFADWLIFALIVNLPRLSRMRPPAMVQTALMLIVLALTQVRSSWLGLLIGLLVFVALSPRRIRNLSFIAVSGVIGFVVLSNVSTLLGNATAGNSVFSRFSTLSDLSHDTSYNDRTRYFGTILANAAERPTGEGLGDIGTASKLGASGATTDFDNGYVGRFVEMGTLGFLGYAVTLVLAFGFSVCYWLRAARLGLEHEAAIGAAIVATQVVLLFLDVASDHHGGFTGIYFWMTLAFAARVPAGTTEQRLLSRRAA